MRHDIEGVVRARLVGTHTSGLWAYLGIQGWAHLGSNDPETVGVTGPVGETRTFPRLICKSSGF